MARKPPPKADPAQLASEQRIASKAASKTAGKVNESLREKVLLAIVGFMLTGVVGTVITTWIQQRGWAWQNRVAKIEKDTENAIAAYRAVSDLINARWHATYKMTRALERRLEGDEWKAARDDFATADKDWALRYTNVARELDFQIDTPFGIEAGEDLKSVWTLTCGEFALRGSRETVPVRSARVVMEVINHCHGKMKDELEGLVDNRPRAATPEGKAIIDLSYRRLDHLYRTNDALRCIIFERALAIRRTAGAESYWGTFFGIGQAEYKLPDGMKSCVT